jgi:hypothetical protein
MSAPIKNANVCPIPVDSQGTLSRVAVSGLRSARRAYSPRPAEVAAARFGFSHSRLPITLPASSRLSSAKRARPADGKSTGMNARRPLLASRADGFRSLNYRKSAISVKSPQLQTSALLTPPPQRTSFECAARRPSIVDVDRVAGWQPANKWITVWLSATGTSTTAAPARSDLSVEADRVRPARQSQSSSSRRSQPAGPIDQPTLTEAISFNPVPIHFLATCELVCREETSARGILFQPNALSSLDNFASDPPAEPEPMITYSRLGIPSHEQAERACAAHRTYVS